MYQDEISGFGLTFKKLTINDLPSLVAWRNDPHVLPFMDDTRKVDVRIMSAWFNRVSSLDTFQGYIVCRKDVPFAYSEFKDIDTTKGQVWEGIFFNPDFINSGLFFNLQFVREMFLMQNNLGTIISQVRKINHKSIKAQENLGGEITREDEDFVYFTLTKEKRLQALYKFSTILGFDAEFKETFKDWRE